MKIFQTLKLLLPAIIPSWNFFDIIAPSPRIQFALLNSEHKVITPWEEFRPRPAFLSFSQMLKRMVWNPRWNESLFMVSCAERIMENYTQHSENEILSRIEAHLKLTPDKITASHFQFQLLYIQRQGDKLIEKVLFSSAIKEIFRESAS